LDFLFFGKSIKAVCLRFLHPGDFFS
jgi:hypothetical protein